MFTGTIEGHSAAVNICIGFKPQAVIFYNESDLANEAALAAAVYKATSSSDNTNAAKVMGIFNHGTTQCTANAATLFDHYDGGDEPDGTDAYQDGDGTALVVYSTSEQLTEEGFTLSADAQGDGDDIRFIALG